MILKERGGNNDVHALLSPSGAKKWLSCAASLACEKDIPNTSGKAAVTGTACHTIAEVHLNQYIKGTALPLEREVGAYVLDEGKGQIKALISPMKGAVLITADMIEQVRKYTDYCKPIIDVATYAKLEMRVNLTEVLHPGYEGVETFGTADLVAVQELANTDEHMLIIGDLKTGRHRVEAKENKQLMLYALGVYRRLKRRYNITVVRLVIFQPYAGGASEWDISVEGLELFAKFAQKRALLALDAYFRGKKNLKASDFRPSVDGCQWCRFSEQCAARTKTVNAVLAEELEDDFVLELTPEQLVVEYEKLPLLRQHIDKVEKAMSAALHSGKKVPGYKLVEGKMGNRAWKDAEKVAELYGDKLTKEVLMTPTEAVKVIPEEELGTWLTCDEVFQFFFRYHFNSFGWNQVSEEDLE
nr:MAG TPA: PD-(D/E)XK nuclease superfamily protein [Caudoviricetes sp.]